MARGEHDRPDPGLIIEGPRRPLPSKRVQGCDYPVTPLEEIYAREKAKSAQNTPVTAEGSNPIGGSTHLKDVSKPDGEACCDDGTLKDASEMEWVHSPTQSDTVPHGEKRKQTDSAPDGDVDDIDVLPKTKWKRGRQIIDLDDDDSDFPYSGEGLGGVTDNSSVIESNNESGSELLMADETEEEDTGGRAAQKQKEKEKDATKDIRLCGKTDTGVHPTKKKTVKGWYCRFCLNEHRSRSLAFLTGNVTTRRRHLLRCHLDDYWETCTDAGFTPSPPKDWVPPPGWVPPNERKLARPVLVKQQSIQDFVQKSAKPLAIPPVNKAGIQQHLLAIIATCDLPFRFVERPAIREFITYLNPKVQDSDIPKKSCVAASVNAKVASLEELTFNIIDRISSKVSIIWDGWSTRKRRPYTSFSISFIDSLSSNDMQWELKNYLLEFNSPVGRHTGKLIGEDLLATMRKFRLEKKLGWMVGDGASANDVAVRTVCKELDPSQRNLKAKEVRILCIDHSMHRAAYHFIRELSIPSTRKGKSKSRAEDANVPEVENNDADSDIDLRDDDNPDVDVSMDIDASADDAEAMMGTTLVDFDTGDTLGKLLAFINQVRMSSEGVREFLAEMCVMHHIKPIELRLWVRTRWGSLSDCLKSALQIQKAIESFCLAADANDDLPSLKNKIWMDYRLSPSEWKLIQLVYDCLKVVATRHNELSNETSPTCTRVLPMLELLISEWEDLLDKSEYEPVHDALKAGIALMGKYYRRADDTDAYFIAHVLDPTLKAAYLEVAWEEKYLNIGLQQFKSRFLKYKTKYEASQTKPAYLDMSESSNVPAGVGPALSSTDAWMEKMIKKKHDNHRKPKIVRPELVAVQVDPLDELQRYLRQPRLTRGDCPNPVAWWGHQSEYPVLRLMARDYLAIPATSCIAERSFSLSARTDDPRRRQMKKEKFGGLQKLRAGYMDGRLRIEGDITNKYINDFDFDNNDYID